ncbi:MAG: hypothetical protein Kow0056_16030 [Coriobacteriia bacterium]
MDTARTVLCEIITPERIIYTDEAQMVVAPTIDGEIGILPLHAPLVSVLKPGEVRVKVDSENTEWVAVSGGYIQVHEDKVIILADDAALAGQIDVEEARRRKERIEARLSEAQDDEGELDRLERDLRWCEIQMSVAEKCD